MLNYTLKLMVFLSFLSASTARAQNVGNKFTIERYDIQRGLTHSHVYQVFQDSRDFIWLVTGDALMLYDGHIFIPVMHWEVIKSPNYIRLLFEDRSGKIWLRKNRDDYCLIDIRSFEITSLREALPGKLPEQIDCIAQGTDGIISIISIKNGLYRYNSASREIKNYPLRLDADLLVDGDGDNFWFFREYVSTRIGISGYLDARLPELKPVNLKLYGRLRVLSNGRMGGISEKGLVVLNQDASVHTQKIDGYNKFYNFNIVLINCTSPAATEEQGRYCWIYFHDRLLKLDIQNKTAEDFTVSHGLSSLPTVFDVLKDRQGTYWIATAEGLVKIGSVPVRFRRYFWEDTERLKIAPRNSCRGITQAKNGDIYLGFSKELHRKKSQESDFNHFTSTGAAIIDVQMSDDQETVWLGSGDLMRYHTDKNRAEIIHRPDSVKLGEIWSVYEDNDRVWLGYSTELLYFDKNTGCVVPYYSSGTPGELTNTDIYQIDRVPDKDSLWLATSKGLFLFNRERKIAGWFGSGEGSPVHFPCDNIRHINQTAPDQIWMATSCGLISWNPLSGSVRLIAAQEGLPNSNLYAVYPDDYGFLWMSSDMGIIQYHISSGQVRHFTAQEGVSSNEFNRISHLKTDDGTIYFGSINGATAFHPASFASDFFSGHPAGLVLLSARAQGPNPGETVDLLPQYIHSGRIQINPDERFVRLHFALPDYRVAGTVKYYYKIEGVHNSWQLAESPDITFPQLPVGKYKIYLRTGSMSGVSSAGPLVIDMEILPRFYQRPWFYLMVVVLVAALIMAAWRIRIRLLLSRQLELEGKVGEATQQILADKQLIEMQMKRISNISEEKNRFFVNITHELRTPLTLVTAPLEELQRRKLPPKREADLLSTALRNSRQLLILINDLLQLSKDEHIQPVGGPHPVDLIPLIEDVIRLHEYGATQKGIRFHFVRGTLEKPVVAGEEKLVRRVLMNIISNAVKFSDRNGKIVIEISNQADTITVAIADNGRGIDPVDMPHIFERFYQTQRADMPLEGGTGIGLSIAREIMDAFRGHIRVESEPGKGSTFFLDFCALTPRDTAGEVVASMDNISIETVSTAKKRRIIVVDDNPEIVGFLSLMLGDEFDVSSFFSAESVLTSLSQGVLPDLLICDLMMPTMNGFQLIENIRNIKAFDNMKILVLTAMASQDVGTSLTSMGIDGIILKPFSSDVLKKQILELMRTAPSAESVQLAIPVSQELSEEQSGWLRNLNHLIISQMAATDFSVDKLAADMRISRSTFFRELARLTSLTPNEYIQIFRLEYARMLLESGEVHTLTQLLDRIGMKDKVYFSRMYKERFGKSPRTYITRP